MKKIVNRLILQSVGLLLAFALMIALLFGVLFTKQTADLHQEDLIRRNEVISSTMSDFFKSDIADDSQGRNRGSMGGYGAFLRFVNQIAGENVWVLNKEMTSLVADHHSKNSLSTPPPKNARSLVAKTYESQTNQVQQTRSFFQINSLLVSTPIIVDGNVVGTVLIQSDVAGTHENQRLGYLLLLISLTLAALVAGFLAWYSAKRFVAPITKMKSYVEDLTDENYHTELVISTKDELKALGDQLSVLSQRLSLAQLARERKQQSEKDFLSQISHELRTPVMVIKSSLEAINDGYLDANEQHESLQHLRLETENLERLVNDLLELSRLESTEFQLEKESVDILNCITDALRSYRLPFREKRQTAVFTNALSQKRLISGDYQRLTQAFKILLDNANKYAPVDTEICLAAEETDQWLKVRLTNSHTQGVFDTTDLFESFHRGQSSYKNSTGLGLAIAKQVIRRHHGQISAVADENFFTIEILLPFS